MSRKESHHQARDGVRTKTVAGGVEGVARRRFEKEMTNLILHWRVESE